MSVLTRPSVVFAIVFGCFAVLIPRILWPIIRNTFGLNPPVKDDEINFHRPPARERISEGEQIEYIHLIYFEGSPPHMRGLHPRMREHAEKSENSSKSLITFVLPIYAVGISIYLIYTVCKVISKRSTNKEKNCLKEYKNTCWDSDIKQFHTNDEHATGLYTDMDPEYAQYLKKKKKKRNETEKFMTAEQKQMHQTLADMKNSLTFISSKLMTKQKTGSLDGDEITQLQSRLEATESQMCQVLNVLQTASDRVGQLTNNSATTVNQNQPPMAQSALAKTKLNSTLNKASKKKLPHIEDIEDEESDESDTSETTDDDRDFNNEEESDQAPNSLNVNDKPSHYDTSESLSSDDEYEHNQSRHLTDQEDDPTDLMELGYMETNYDQHPSTVNDYKLKKNTTNRLNHKISVGSGSNNSTSKNQTTHLWNNRKSNSNSQSFSDSTSGTNSDDNKTYQNSYNHQTILKHRRKH
ncbi:unnamed protein product [Didymodactylos carnosus]|uniref:Resistance to inhibitors of cholinesterase protein 3 N-terminal domain-containing protein n=1 Tax=Didymodactylos carnosus TaxID=1234261 RepID=A0A8S2CVE8_9BILA|nr:unnamed protein product [Didymodactylos carnosus]CAF3514218.1 unnamed protein product [Didymodactylos carnosus]